MTPLVVRPTEIIGKVFGVLTVLAVEGYDKRNHINKLKCQCECGNTCTKAYSVLYNKNYEYPHSCGCRKIDIRAKRHQEEMARVPGEYCLTTQELISRLSGMYNSIVDNKPEVMTPIAVANAELAETIKNFVKKLL